HLFEVRAIDLLGNVDPTPAGWPWTIDSAAPDTQITIAPPDPSALASAHFEFTASEPGSFECALDGGAFAACSSPLDSAALADGSHTFQARAIDLAGNV